ncbi:hypothetical protein VTI28DRAFT_6373 [Corynascus sepedonium]
MSRNRSQLDRTCQGAHVYALTDCALAEKSLLPPAAARAPALLLHSWFDGVFYAANTCLGWCCASAAGVEVILS